MTNHQPDKAPNSTTHRQPVAMCESCERVPVPVHFVNRGLLRRLYVCADCLAEEGIHVEEGGSAALFDDDTPDAAQEEGA